MRYGILSDIHANLEALQAVLLACQDQNVQHILCIGDTLGYGANPQECLNILRDIKAKSVAGNHDWAVSGRLDASFFPEDGKEAINFSRKNISMEEISSLNNLELVYENDDLVMVHSTLHTPERFIYLRDIDEAKETFRMMSQPICFVGHTHIQQVYVQKNDSVFKADVLEFEMEKDVRYIVNVGSVGQPRDGNPMASYCIYDTALSFVELKRAPYDIPAAQSKILEADLPSFLADRLDKGK